MRRVIITIRTGFVFTLAAALVGCSREPAKPFNKGMKLIGFDASEELVTGLSQGRLNGLVLQNPVKMGYLGVKRIVSVIRDGAKLEAREDTGLTLATKENMADAEVKGRLSPDLKILDAPPPTSPPPAGKKPLRIAVIPKGETHEFWKSIHAGAIQAAQEAGGVEILWKGPLKEDDRGEQIKVVQDFVVGKVDGIVLAPLDEEALADPVKEARRAGIPVVIIDSGLKGDGHLSYIATDNYKGGAAAAREMAKLLGAKGKVVMLRMSPGHESTGQREAGFKETLAKEFPNIALANDTLYGGVTRSESQAKATDLLTLVPDADGVFCPNENTTYGMLLALDEKKR